MDSLETWEELHNIHNRWHVITLPENIRNKMILRGLSIQKAPSVMDSESFIRACKSVLNRCSSALIDNTIQYVNKDEFILQRSWKERDL